MLSYILGVFFLLRGACDSPSSICGTSYLRELRKYVSQYTEDLCLSSSNINNCYQTCLDVTSCARKIPSRQASESSSLTGVQPAFITCANHSSSPNDLSSETEDKLCSHFVYVKGNGNLGSNKPFDKK